MNTIMTDEQVRSSTSYLSRLIKQQRVKSGKKQVDLGNHLGTTGQYICNVERGKRLAPRHFEKTAEYIGASLLDMIGADIQDHKLKVYRQIEKARGKS